MKVTKSQVQEFTILREKGLTYKEIASEFDVDMSTVHKRVNYYG